MRIIRIFLSIVVVFAVQSVVAQDLFSKGASPDLHLEHTVVPKETWYSLGRSYNLSPKDIAAYNNLSMDRPLEIAQVIRIPLNNTNFSQGDSKAPDEVFVPVYHIVGEKEWMYRIGLNHNKVPVEKLERWNNIKSADLKAGMKLVVGYLKVKSGNVLASANTNNSTAEVPRQTPPPVKEEVKASPPSTTITTTTSNSPQTNTSSSASTGSALGAVKEGGYFKAMYRDAGKSTSGISGIFKSTSGWNDHKYYALMSNVSVGTIIKVTFPQTGKSIFAKVLGELPDMKESAGLTLRISDAAANELGATANKFSVDISY